jgi:hypothetical protein
MREQRFGCIELAAPAHCTCRLDRRYQHTERTQWNEEIVDGRLDPSIDFDTSIESGISKLSRNNYRWVLAIK